MSQPLDPASLQLALDAGWSLLDHGAFGEVVDEDGALLALVGYDPPQVEVDLSVVLVVREEELQEAAEAADRLLRAEQLGPWTSEGFVPAELGAVHEGELDSDPEQGVLSYDLPVTSLARDRSGVLALLRFAAKQPRDFALWGAQGPLTVLEPR